MVSFVCDLCQETLKKAKLDQHKNRCYGASFSCIDCSTSFRGIDYRAHTSCVTEAEKYEKSLGKQPKKGLNTNTDSNRKEVTTTPLKKPAPILEQIEVQAGKAENRKRPLPSEKRKAALEESTEGDKEKNIQMSGDAKKYDKNGKDQMENEDTDGMKEKVKKVKKKRKVEELIRKVESKGNESAIIGNKKSDEQGVRNDTVKDRDIEVVVMKYEVVSSQIEERKNVEKTGGEEGTITATNARDEIQGASKRKKKSNKNKTPKSGHASGEKSPEREVNSVKVDEHLSASNVTAEIKIVVKKAGTALSFDALRAKLLEKYERAQGREVVEKLIFENLSFIFKDGAVQTV